MGLSPTDKNMKAEGVKDIFLWMKEKCKEQKKCVDAAEAEYEKAKKEWSMFDDTQCLVDSAMTRLECAAARLNAYVEVKISIEKYMKKLRHEAKEVKAQ